MSPASRKPDSPRSSEVEDRLAAVTSIADPGERRQALAEASDLLNRSTVRELFDDVASHAYVDTERAARSAELAEELAELLDDNFGRGLARKAAGFLLYLRNNQEEALSKFQESAALFAAENEDLEYAASLSTSLAALRYLGRYEEAYKAAAEARAIFEAEGEKLRLARLDSNEGNLLFRQERIGEAQDRYLSALRGLEEEQAPPQDIAAAMLNIVTCSIALHDFDRALETHDRLQRLCELHDMGPVAAQAEYNIAYLYFLRGEYDRALELYREARVLARKVDDRYHQALCDLDQAEILLELNMKEEGGRLAGTALGAFENLGMGYEAGKAITFLGIAASQERKPVQALELFQQARERFENEGNRAWVAVLDLYQAIVFLDEKRVPEARKQALKALEFFEPSRLVGKTVMCELLLAGAALRSGDVDEAEQRAGAALSRLESMDSPALEFRAHFVAGQVAEAAGDSASALVEHQASARLLEDLRSHLKGEEVKLAFLRDKQEVYENLVWLAIDSGPSQQEKDSIFLQMERAKSRVLADLISFRAGALPAVLPGHSHLVERMRELRNELNWYYRQIDLEEVRSAAEGSTQRRIAAAEEADSAAPGPRRLTDLQEKSRQYEQQLIEVLAEVRDSDLEFGSLQTASIMDLESIRAALPDRAMILEFFEARDTVFCCCLGKSKLEILLLTTGTLVREHQRKLSFQLSKFRLGSEYTDRFGDALLQSTQNHLRALYHELIAPLAPHLDAEHLIVVPHGTMHYLPFHAFLGDEDYLIDEFSLSYSPSANVYALCAGKKASQREAALILGVPTDDAPGIRREVNTIAGVLPDASLYLGEEATEDRLRADGAGARLIHIATHGFFRQDNPMFSAIQLGTSRLTLFDLYQLRLDADLVVLSGCGTGLNVVEGGDELIGLGRGLLYAGARSVIASLWDAHDESTARFMNYFYRLLLKTDRPARALREAMQAVRETHPHPYYWAPFLLVGQFAPRVPSGPKGKRPRARGKQKKDRGR